MKIVVIGGTGLIGSKVVADLRQKGHELIAAARELQATVLEQLQRVVGETSRLLHSELEAFCFFDRVHGNPGKEGGRAGPEDQAWRCWRVTAIW